MMSLDVFSRLDDSFVLSEVAADGPTS